VWGRPQRLEFCDDENFRAVATIGLSEAFADLIRRGYREQEARERVR